MMRQRVVLLAQIRGEISSARADWIEFLDGELLADIGRTHRRAEPACELEIPFSWRRRQRDAAAMKPAQDFRAAKKLATMHPKTANRGRNLPDLWDFYFGFRVVRTLGEQE
jgi:hypothetical protein